MKIRVRFFMTLVGTLAIAALAPADFPRDRKEHDLVLQLVPSQNAIQPGVPEWKVGATVFVLVRVINNSNQAVHYSLTSPFSDWEMDVRDESGNPVPETEQFRKLKHSSQGLETSRNILVTLKPHETGQDTVDVSYKYKLNRAGKYFIQVRRVFPEIGQRPVESNRLELMVEQ